MTPEELEQAFAGPYRSLQDVAVQFGVSRQRIHQLVVKYEIARPARPAVEDYWEAATRRSRSNHAPRSRWPREGIPALKRTHNICMWFSCWLPAREGRIHCEQHGHENTENAGRYTRKRTLQRKAEGVCTRCAGAYGPRAEGKLLCHRCRAMVEVARKRYKNKQRRTHGN